MTPLVRHTTALGKRNCIIIGTNLRDFLRYGGGNNKTSCISISPQAAEKNCAHKNTILKKKYFHAI